MIDEALMIGLASVFLMVLIYFAGVQRGRQYRKEDLRARAEGGRRDRIQNVVDIYMRLWETHQDSGISALIKAGVKQLFDNGEIREEAQIIRARTGKTPLTADVAEAIPETDLKAFFGELEFKHGRNNFAEVLQQFRRK